MQKLDGNESRFNPSNVIAACIVAIGLVAAALIVAHRPQAIAADIPSAKSMAPPPITQESAGKQFSAQILAAPELHTVKSDGVTATLTNIEVYRVAYSSKTDTYDIFYTWDWKPNISDHLVESPDTTLTSDGYGHYFGDVTLNNNTTVTVTIK